MKIKWIGKYDGDNLPRVEAETDAKSLPEVTTRSAVILLPILLIFSLCVYCKSVYLGGTAFSKVNWMIGIIIGLLFFLRMNFSMQFVFQREVMCFCSTRCKDLEQPVSHP